MQKNVYQESPEGNISHSKVEQGRSFAEGSFDATIDNKSLYTGDRKIYLEEWYQTLLKEIEEIHEDLRIEKNLSSVEELKSLTVARLIEEISNLKQMLMAYKTKCDEQALVIEKLMKQVVKRHERVEKYS